MPSTSNGSNGSCRIFGEQSGAITMLTGPLYLNSLPDKLVSTAPVSSVRSPSPSQLPIAAPLLEMGFTFRHIQKAIHATG